MVVKGRYMIGSKTAGRASKSVSEWPNLPADVLQLIAKQYLDIFDAHSLSAVCKDWNLQSSSLLHPPEAEPPWLLSRDLSKLYQSRHVSNKPCAITACARGNKSPDCYPAPVASKLGWLLMKHCRRVIDDNCYFFWNPFARGKRMKILDLPPLETSGSLDRYLFATFSRSPDSPECVVFGVNYEHRFSKDLLIGTCSPGDRKWKKHVFTCQFQQDKEASLSGIVYVEQHQMLYCLFEDGSLGAFCPTDSSWNLLIDARRMFDPLVGLHGDCLVESGGELLLACRFLRTNGGTRIFKFDPCQVAWVLELDSLADRVLFLGYCNLSISVAATGRMAALAGRIYVLEYDGVWCIEGESVRKGRSDDLFRSEVSEQCLNGGMWVLPPYAK